MSRGGHLDSREIARYLDDELDPGARVRVEEHLAGCPDCRIRLREAWRARSWWRRRGWESVAVPAGVAAAVALLVVALPLGEGPEQGAPDSRTTVLERGPEAAGGTVDRFSVRRPTDGATVPDASEGVVLAWASVPGDITYEVTLTSEDGGPLWTGTTRDTVVRVPAEVGLEAGRSYLWYVDALLADGRSATTGTRSFQVAP